MLQIALNCLFQGHGGKEPPGRFACTCFESQRSRVGAGQNIVASSDGVTFSVRDFGRGIAPDQHHNLFERFFRVRGEKADTYPGLGLGLYISAQIINQHEGRIWVESEEDRGATFAFFLPFKSDQAEEKVQVSFCLNDILICYCILVHIK